MDSRKKKLILLLKQVRIEKGLSYQDIVDRCESIEQTVSLATVKRVFGPNSENQEFRYASLRPIVFVLLGVEYDQDEEDSSSEADALRAVIEVKGLHIEKLESDVADLRHRLNVHERTCKVLAVALAIVTILLGLALLSEILILT